MIIKEKLPIRCENIYLRLLLEEDVNETYLSWLHDPKVVRYLEARFVAYTMDSLRASVQKGLEDKNALTLAVVLNQGERHIGNIRLNTINWQHAFAAVGLMIGDPLCWGKGYASEAITGITHYAFSCLGLRKLWAGCYAGNQASLRAFQKVGYCLEGRQIKHYKNNEGYEDGLLLGLLKETFVGDKAFV